MYKEDNDFEKRFKECKNILEKYPKRIPVIVERFNKCKNIENITNLRYYGNIKRYITRRYIFYGSGIRSTFLNFNI